MVDPSGQIGIMDIIYIGVAVGSAVYQAVDQVMDYVGGDLDDYWDAAWDYAEETWDDVWSGDSCYEAPAPPPPARLADPTVSSGSGSHFGYGDLYKYNSTNDKPCYYCHSNFDMREPTGFENVDYAYQYSRYGEVYDDGKLQLFKHKRYIDQAGFDQSSEDLTWATGELLFDFAGEGLPSLRHGKIPYVINGYQLGTSLYNNATWPTETYYNKSPWPPW